MSEVEKTPDTAAEVAGEAGPVIVESESVEVKPGGRTVVLAPVHWIELELWAAFVVRKVAPQVAVAPNVQPEGAVTVTEVIA